MSLEAKYDTILTPLTIDVSTGDAITPHAVEYDFCEIFDNTQVFRLWAYNIETVLAEKIETILRRTVFNTRPRDYYDAYILFKTQKYDKALLRKALAATANHRGTEEQIQNPAAILEDIEESKAIHGMWDKYRRQFGYAKEIAFEDIMQVLMEICAEL